MWFGWAFDTVVARSICSDSIFLSKLITYKYPCWTHFRQGGKKLLNMALSSIKRPQAKIWTFNYTCGLTRELVAVDGCDWGLLFWPLIGCMWQDSVLWLADNIIISTGSGLICGPQIVCLALYHFLVLVPLENTNCKARARNSAAGHITLLVISKTRVSN